VTVSSSARPFEILRSCPGCGGRAIAVAYPPNLCRCACGLYFENPRPRPAAIRAYYDRGATYCRFRREERVRELLWAKRLRLVARFCASGRLLDVGTGDGHFLRHAARRFAAEGTEISRAGVLLAREHGLEVHHGTLAELSLETGAYDAVTLWHVLEHLPDPADELVRVWRLLAPGGHLFVAVPNETRTLDLQRLLRRRRSPYLPLRPGDEIHLTHFTPRTLRALLGRQGFRVLRTGADDVDTERTPVSRARELLRRSAGAAAGRRWSTAMVAVCRREAGAA
jgi:SAM-dependent methyltransferase